MDIRGFREADVPDVVRMWNGAVASGEMLYRPLTEGYFREKFLSPEVYEPGLLLAAEEGGRVVGFIAGCRPRAFLPGQTEANTPGYLTMLLVDAGQRRRGVGSALLLALEDALKGLGKTALAVSSLNPVNLDWVIPGTPGHEHNKAPGADEEGPGYPFLLNRGFVPRVREAAMYLDLSQYEKSPDVEGKRESLRAQGVTAGLYDPALGYEFDEMCDRVGSEYWRKVLRDELAKESPRPILAATVPGHIVAFTGPVDRQESGRGWFTGICTDPQYERRGIATVLFADLMEQFLRAGARYSTLFTGVENHAQRLYAKAGFRAARHFAIMNKDLKEKDGY
ncbi:MAG TPA: GNAT family N-acetyltransferase [Candidatus Limnocylindria bacterium]|nr:GNAT family N-acetyltransferase [Candidatus Limnocylindria bacterium]